MIRFVSVAALSDEAPSLIASHPKGRCCNTGDASRLGVFAFLATVFHTIASAQPGGVEENGIGIQQSSCWRCKPEITRLSRRIYKTGGAHLSRVRACRFRASGLNLGFPYRWGRGSLWLNFSRYEANQNAGRVSARKANHEHRTSHPDEQPGKAF